MRNVLRTGWNDQNELRHNLVQEQDYVSVLVVTLRKWCTFIAVNQSEAGSKACCQQGILTATHSPSTCKK